MANIEKRRRSRAPPLVSILTPAHVILAGLLPMVGCDGGDETTTAAAAAPLMQHGPPNEAAGQMCVVCHTCGDDGTGTGIAPIIDRTHDVCNSCHGPDGGLTMHTEDPCQWEMDCEATPPSVNCNECHTVEYVNDLCEACHVP